ncbi:hypothetical protein VTL71DRAFT_10920 [Oculimacula yallundae]|uniref:Uncharacterized protein n=1 Tax=Oculimacula yallundae TaxID=86028 RepID=A0ABR4CX03_9HELO
MQVEAENQSTLAGALGLAPSVSADAAASQYIFFARLVSFFFFFFYNHRFVPSGPFSLRVVRLIAEAVRSFYGATCLHRLPMVSISDRQISEQLGTTKLEFAVKGLSSVDGVPKTSHSKSFRRDRRLVRLRANRFDYITSYQGTILEGILRLRRRGERGLRTYGGSYINWRQTMSCKRHVVRSCKDGL